ncbi:alpha/beta hydrolase family protein [Alteribacter natronophilus]|uniref:alpha/beta hydrolase family protein n=1 Tax=Alteribacter natronophilus TaxID=2583810 RepID=UPI00110EFAA4|nr:prolyl oligopeptidase family serine peptidase [Alteribacter natronophilus]TMW70367.1 S9 family peptidase [Alteribacter natronophilus]
MKLYLLMTGLCILLLACSTDTLVETDEVSTNSSTITETMTYMSDGYQISGFIVRPNTDEENLPVLIYNRGGNRDFGAIDHRIVNQLRDWAEDGYVVLASQYRGTSDSEGEDEFGGADVTDVLALEQVAEELAYADSSRMFMLGYSRGGMMTYLAAKEGMNLTGAAVVGAPANLVDGYGESDPAMRQVLEDLIGDPEDHTDAYEARSAVHWPEDIDVPLLILHGENDQRVDVDQARRLAYALEGDYRLIVYEDGSHGLQEHHDEYVEEVRQWFRQYGSD